ncbi:MAG: hypothetical protein BMS9Abin37_0361 [Acidobacteriota bacterium]|nr:MAG: hypothetical protein BMS9Abin37_0361 [Acidobacteriota bacterium]
MDSRRTSLRLRAQNPEILTAFLEDGVDIRVRLSGFSMKPLMRSGSVLRFSAREMPRVGDIVLLSFSDGANRPSRASTPIRHAKLVAHRVLALDDDCVWTKGDSSGTPDPPVPWSRVLASATTLETGGAFAIPLGNGPMRALGLLMSSWYPRLVRAYRTVWPRKPRKDAFGCAS